MTELLCETPERASLSLLITQGCLNRSIVSEARKAKERYECHRHSCF
jgi:hypothetical protein